VRFGRDGRIGVTLASRWRLDRKIGSGGVATVFAGTDLRDNRSVAVKVLHDDLSGDEDVCRRFLREGVVVNRIDHPGVVHVDDAGTDGDRTYLVMGLLEGQTLKEAWQSAGEKLSEAEVVRHLERLLDIVVAAHAAGVVHRDLKADNIFLTTAGELKLLDFGIARLRDTTSTDDSATAAGSMLGTPACMPPEQALGKWDEVDERADVYAMGATAFRMLTGKPIHEAGSLPELLMAVASKPARPIRSVSQHIAPALAGVIDRALAFERTARWSSAAEMLAALRRAHASDEPTDPTPPSSETTTATRQPVSHSAVTNEWSIPASIEPTTDRIVEADDDLNMPTAAMPLLYSGPTILSPSARTALMPQQLTQASANGQVMSVHAEAETSSLAPSRIGQALGAVGESKRSKAQSATAALIAATSAPRRAGTIPMPPQLAAQGSASQTPQTARTVEMPPAAPTVLLGAHVQRTPAATPLIETPSPRSIARRDERDDPSRSEPTVMMPLDRAESSVTMDRNGARVSPTSSVSPSLVQGRPAGSARWLVLALLVSCGVLAGWLLSTQSG